MQHNGLGNPLIDDDGDLLVDLHQGLEVEGELEENVTCVSICLTSGTEWIYNS